MTMASAHIGFNGTPPVLGGTLYENTTYYFRSFTGNGTLVLNQSITMDIALVGGGGGGGPVFFINYGAGGGGGGGGILESYSQTLGPGTYNVVIGGGGSGGTTSAIPGIGGITSLGSYTINGGGYGAGITNFGIGATFIAPTDGAGVGGGGQASGGSGGGGAWGAGGRNSKSRTITIASTPVNDFQVRVVLNTSNFDYSTAKSDGGDIRFTTTGGTTMSYWIEKWTQNGTSVIWVKVPTSGTTSFNMTYGNPALTTTSNIDNVMDQALLCYYYGSGTASGGAQAFQTLDFVAQDTGANIANYSWGSGTVTVAGQGTRTDYVSLRWRGWVKPSTTTGNNIFHFTTDDGQRLYVGSDSSSLAISSPPSTWTLSSWIDQGATEYNTTVAINDSVPRFIWNEWFETGGGATSKLGWTPAGGTKSYPITVGNLRAPKYNATFGDPFAYAATVGSESNQGPIITGSGAAGSTKGYAYRGGDASQASISGGAGGGGAGGVGADVSSGIGQGGNGGSWVILLGGSGGGLYLPTLAAVGAGGGGGGNSSSSYGITSIATSRSNGDGYGNGNGAYFTTASGGTYFPATSAWIGGGGGGAPVNNGFTAPAGSGGAGFVVIRYTRSQVGG